MTLSISFCFLYDVRMHLFVLFFGDCCTIGEFYPYIFITHTKKGRTHYIMSQNLPQNSLLRVTKYYSYFLHTYMIKATILKPSNTSWIMIKFVLLFSEINAAFLVQSYILYKDSYNRLYHIHCQNG